MYDRQFVQGLSLSLAQFEKDLPDEAKRLASMPPGPSAPPPISLAMLFGEQKYRKIPVPILAIFAVPHSFDEVLRDNPIDLCINNAIIDIEVLKTYAQAEGERRSSGGPAQTCFGVVG
jgi:hypothetical protein